MRLNPGGFGTRTLSPPCISATWLTKSSGLGTYPSSNLNRICRTSLATFHCYKKQTYIIKYFSQQYYFPWPLTYAKTWVLHIAGNYGSVFRWKAILKFVTKEKCRNQAISASSFGEPEALIKQDLFSKSLSVWNLLKKLMILKQWKLKSSETYISSL